MFQKLILFNNREKHRHTTSSKGCKQYVENKVQDRTNNNSSRVFRGRNGLMSTVQITKISHQFKFVSVINVHYLVTSFTNHSFFSSSKSKGFIEFFYSFPFKFRSILFILFFFNLGLLDYIQYVAINSSKTDACNFFFALNLIIEFLLSFLHIFALYQKIIHNFILLKNFFLFAFYNFYLFFIKTFILFKKK